MAIDKFIATRMDAADGSRAARLDDGVGATYLLDSNPMRRLPGPDDATRTA
jgi:hypothetical protein